MKIEFSYVHINYGLDLDPYFRKLALDPDPYQKDILNIEEKLFASQHFIRDGVRVKNFIEIDTKQKKSPLKLFSKLSSFL